MFRFEGHRPIDGYEFEVSQLGPRQVMTAVRAVFYDSTGKLVSEFRQQLSGARVVAANPDLIKAARDVVVMLGRELRPRTLHAAAATLPSAQEEDEVYDSAGENLVRCWEEWKAWFTATRIAAKATAALIAYQAQCTQYPPCDPELQDTFADILADAIDLVSDRWQSLQNCRNAPQGGGGGGGGGPYYEEVCNYDIWYYEDTGEVVSWNTTSCWYVDTSGNMS